MIDHKHRVTEKENYEAWEIFADREKYFSLSDEQELLVDAFIAAGEMKHVSGEWPTLQEVADKWQREAESRAAKRAKLEEEWLARNAKQQNV